MATGSYKIQTNKEMNSIFYRFKQGAQFDVIVSIGIKVPKDRWSASKQEVLSTTIVEYKKINQKLKDFNSYVNREYETTKLVDELHPINSKWLKERIDIFFIRESNDEEVNNKQFFKNFIEVFIAESYTRKTRKNKPLKPRTIQHYITTLNKIKDFEEHIGRAVKLSEINMKFHSHFISFLETVQNLNPNTIGGYIDDIRLFCKFAEIKGIPISQEYRLKDFYSPNNETNDIYLKEAEIEKVYRYNFTQDYLDNARDWFIIGLWTGLRVSDLLILTDKDIEDGFIKITNIKTEFPVLIPLHIHVAEILAKRNGKFPRNIKPQKFNQYIKKIAKLSEIDELTDGARMAEMKTIVKNKEVKIFRKTFGVYPKYELVTSHICRRTFATNLYGKIPTFVIMNVTGHKTETQFLSYIKTTKRESAEILKDYWGKQQISLAG